MDNTINWPDWAKKTTKREDRKQLRRQFTGALLASGNCIPSHALSFATTITDELLALEAAEEAEVKDEAL